MNPLLILEDRINILSERCGLVLVKRDFPFRDIKVDLGFEHRFSGDYNDESFYSVPILDFSSLGYENPENVEAQILKECAAHASLRNKKGVAGFQRFLVRYKGKPELSLVKVSAPKNQNQTRGRLSESEIYWHADSEVLSSRVPDFANQLARIEQEYQTLASHADYSTRL